MTLKEYFTTQTGSGILSTADRQGRVSSAIYARPRVLPDGTIALLMRERRAYRNICENPHAAYLFIEREGAYRGVRLTLCRIGELNDAELIRQLTRRTLTEEEDLAKGPKHLVQFRIEKILDLIGPQERTFTGP